MNTITGAQFRRLSQEGMMSSLPLIITHNDNPTAVVARPEDVVILSDLHPRMRNMIKAMEKRARMGMPPPERVILDLEPAVA